MARGFDKSYDSFLGEFQSRNGTIDAKRSDFQSKRGLKAGVRLKLLRRQHSSQKDPRGAARGLV